MPRHLLLEELLNLFSALVQSWLKVVLNLLPLKLQSTAVENNELMDVLEALLQIVQSVVVGVLQHQVDLLQLRAAHYSPQVNQQLLQGELELLIVGRQQQHIVSVSAPN